MNVPHPLSPVLVASLLLSLVSLAPGAIVVQGSSMDPAIESGQVVVCEHDVEGLQDVEEGDIAAFHWNDRTYVHRVVNVHEGGDAIMAEGDANVNQTEYVPIENVRCVVDRTSLVLPAGGSL